MKKRFLGFNMQLFLAYIFLVVLPVLTAGFIFAWNNVRTSQKDQMYLLEKYSQKTADSLDSIISDADKIVRMQMVDENVLKAAAEDCTSNLARYVHNSKIIEEAIKNAFLYNFDLRGVYLENMSHQYYEVSYTLYFRDTIKDNLWEWGEEAETLPEGRKILVQRSRDGSIQSLLVIHALKDINRNRKLGYVCVEVGFNSVKNLLEDLQADNAYVLLTDGQGEVVFDLADKDSSEKQDQNDKVRAFCQNADFKESDTIGGYITLSGDNYMACGIKISGTDLLLLNCMRQPTFRFSSIAGLLPYLCLFVITSVLDFILSLVFSRKVTRSINNLCTAIESCTDGDIRTIEIQDSLFEDEIKMLLRSYNHLAGRLRASAEREYQQKLREKMMGLKMLQAQINPHFLYNTLNTISSIANIHQIESIQTISNNIAGMLRYSIKSPPLVKIRDEVTQICRYMDIQKLRLPGKFIFDLDIDEELMELYCPVFTLQPVVENAVIHGLTPMEGKGIIQIYGYRKEEDIWLSIRDNGVGIEEEMLERLRNSMVQDMCSELEYDSIGLGNVYQRLHLYYGNMCGLSIDSRVGEGTTVLIHMRKSPDNPMPA